MKRAKKVACVACAHEAHHGPCGATLGALDKRCECEHSRRSAQEEAARQASARRLAAGCGCFGALFDIPFALSRSVHVA